MTPEASLEALIAKWRVFAAGKLVSGDDYYDGQRCGIAKCAKELEAAIQSSGREWQAREIHCPLCGETVKQVASDTLSLALYGQGAIHERADGVTVARGSLGRRRLAGNWSHAMKRTPADPPVTRFRHTTEKVIPGYVAIHDLSEKDIQGLAEGIVPQWLQQTAKFWCAMQPGDVDPRYQRPEGKNHERKDS